jgi:hypothetical protein
MPLKAFKRGRAVMTEDDVMKEDQSQRMFESLDNPMLVRADDGTPDPGPLAWPCAKISAGCFTAGGVASSNE